MLMRETAGIAQWLERQPSKLRVAGSSPVSRSNKRAHVAQLVEHILGKDEVHRFDPGRGLHKLTRQKFNRRRQPAMVRLNQQKRRNPDFWWWGTEVQPRSEAGFRVNLKRR